MEFDLQFESYRTNTNFTSLLSRLKEMAKKPSLDASLSEALDNFLMQLDENDRYLRNGIFNTNFGEAALLLQSSVDVYVKKVDVLWDKIVEYQKHIITCQRELDKEEVKKVEELKSKYKRKRRRDEELHPKDQHDAKHVGKYSRQDINLCSESFEIDEDTITVWKNIDEANLNSTYLPNSLTGSDVTLFQPREDINTQDDDLSSKYNQIRMTTVVEEIFHLEDNILVEDMRGEITRMRLASYVLNNFRNENPNYRQEAFFAENLKRYILDFIEGRKKDDSHEHTESRLVTLNSTSLEKSILYASSKKLGRISVSDVNIVSDTMPQSEVPVLQLEVPCSSTNDNSETEPPILQRTDQPNKVFTPGKELKNKVSSLLKLSADVFLNFNSDPVICDKIHRLSAGEKLCDFQKNYLDCIEKVRNLNNTVGGTALNLSKEKNVSVSDDSNNFLHSHNSSCEDNPSNSTTNNNENNVSVNENSNKNSENNISDDDGIDNITEDNDADNDNTTNNVSNSDLFDVPENNNLPQKSKRKLHNTFLETTTTNETQIVKKTKTKHSVEVDLVEVPNKRINKKTLKKLATGVSVCFSDFEKFYTHNYQKDVHEEGTIESDDDTESICGSVGELNEDNCTNEINENAALDSTLPNDSPSKTIRLTQDSGIGLSFSYDSELNTTQQSLQLDDNLDVSRNLESDLTNHTAEISEMPSDEVVLNALQSAEPNDDLNDESGFEETGAETTMQLEEDISHDSTSNSLTQACSLTDQESIDRNVNNWKSFILPKLKAIGNKSDFDIHEYGSRMIDPIPLGESRAFGNIVQNKSSAEVARYFIATLQLVNTHNVEIQDAVAGQLSNSFSIKVISKERHHDKLDSYQAPSEETFRRRLACAQAVNPRVILHSTPLPESLIKRFKASKRRRLSFS